MSGSDPKAAPEAQAPTENVQVPEENKASVADHPESAETAAEASKASSGVSPTFTTVVPGAGTTIYAGPGAMPFRSGETAELPSETAEALIKARVAASEELAKPIEPGPASAPTTEDIAAANRTKEGEAAAAKAAT